MLFATGKNEQPKPHKATVRTEPANRTAHFSFSAFHLQLFLFALGTQKALAAAVAAFFAGVPFESRKNVFLCVVCGCLVYSLAHCVFDARLPLHKKKVFERMTILLFRSGLALAQPNHTLTKCTLKTGLKHGQWMDDDGELRIHRLFIQLCFSKNGQKAAFRIDRFAKKLLENLRERERAARFSLVCTELSEMRIN